MKSATFLLVILDIYQHYNVLAPRPTFNKDKGSEPRAYYKRNLL